MFCFLHPASLKQHRFRQSIYRHDVHLMMATRKPTRQTHLACPFGHWKFCSLPQHIAEKNHRVWLCLVPLLHWLLNEGNKLYTYLHSSTSSHFDTSSWSSIHESTGIAKKKKKTGSRMSGTSIICTCRYNTSRKCSNYKPNSKWVPVSGAKRYRNPPLSGTPSLRKWKWHPHRGTNHWHAGLIDNIIQVVYR